MLILSRAGSAGLRGGHSMDGLRQAAHVGGVDARHAQAAVARAEDAVLRRQAVHLRGNTPVRLVSLFSLSLACHLCAAMQCMGMVPVQRSMV